MSKIEKALQLRRMLELSAQAIAETADESTVMEVADLFPAWREGVSLKLGSVIKYGVNADGETQLYSVTQAHIAQAEWMPDATPSLYKAIGFTQSGLPIWTQPLGASDAYQMGDRVSHGRKVWVSDTDGNVWEPGIFGWTEGV